jgi:hypothetical protein
MKIEMNFRRILAGLILALLVSASSLGAACDLSCAFTSTNSDCHSQPAGEQTFTSGGMKMDGMAMAGMDMAGMTMPERGGGQDQQAIPAMSQSKTPHPSIGNMGPCEKQSCNDGSAAFARTNGSINPNFHSIPAAIATPRAVLAPPPFHDSREDIAFCRPRNRSSLQLSLRI